MFFIFNILNAPIYGVSNLSFVRFFVNNNALSFGLIITRFFFVSSLFLTFCLALVILIPIAAQLFFIFAANVDAAWLIVGPISTVFNIVPYNASCGDCFRFSFYDLLIAICAVGNSSTHLRLFFLVNNLRYCFNVWFIRFVWSSVWKWKAVDMLSFIFNVFRNFVLNFDVNNIFLSLMIYSKMPWSVNVFFFQK